MIQLSNYKIGEYISIEGTKYRITELVPNYFGRTALKIENGHHTLFITNDSLVKREPMKGQSWFLTTCILAYIKW